MQADPEQDMCSDTCKEHWVPFSLLHPFKMREFVMGTSLDGQGSIPHHSVFALTGIENFYLRNTLRKKWIYGLCLYPL